MSKRATLGGAGGVPDEKFSKSFVEKKREMYCTDKTEPWPTRYRQAVR